MGKIGDLWVRLGLKSDDYKKGMKDAKKETSTFSQGLGKMKAGALAVWAAVGTAVISFAKQMLTATNRMGDAWEMFVAKSTAGWRTFMQSLSAWDWENFIGRFREARQAAEDLQSALDMSFEISNSIKLQKAAMAEELAALENLARNVSKPYKERAKAAQDYLDKVKPIYDQELSLANRLLDAQQDRWLAVTGLQDSTQTRADLAKFLVDYGKVDENKAVLDALAFIRDYQSNAGSRKRNRKSFKEQVALARQYNASKDVVNQFEQANGYQTSLIGLSTAYENLRGDTDTQPLIDALIAAGNAAAAYDNETKRMQQALNQALANTPDDDGNSFAENLAADLQEGLDEVDAAVNALEDVEIEMPEIDLSAYDAAEERIAQFVENWKEQQEEIAQLNDMLSDAIISSISNGVQGFTDMLFGLEDADARGILAGLMQPFADTAGQLGGMLLAQGIAVEAFKTSLASLQGAPAIAAGLSLLAISAAMKSGIQALAGGRTGAGTSASYGGSSYNSNADLTNYESTLTVYVEGKVSGSDILLAGSNQQNKWNR